VPGGGGQQTWATGFRYDCIVHAPACYDLGARGTAAGEMKQVTVLVWDIVDSAPLTERLGPEAMRDLVATLARQARE
jgi:class 3 adenylate cyclase